MTNIHWLALIRIVMRLAKLDYDNRWRDLPKDERDSYLDDITILEEIDETNI